MWAEIIRVDSIVFKLKVEQEKEKDRNNYKAILLSSQLVLKLSKRC